MPRYNDPTPGPRLSVSTWSVHRSLGDPAIYGPADAGIPIHTHNNGAVTMLELPARIAQHGIRTLEICHFHLPSLGDAYLAQLRKAIEDAGVELWQVLADAGDITHPTDGARDAMWIAQWIDVAHKLGAKRVRVIAGKQMPTAENLERAAGHLGWLGKQAENSGVRIVTENWFDLLPSPKETNWLLDTLQGKVGLNGDLGNWAAPEKYAGLSDIMRRAELCHAKANFNEAGLDSADYRKCLEACRTAGYDGPYTLIYDSPFFADEWDGILLEKAFIEDFHQEKQRAAG